ncbi:acetate--CoA ligase [Ruminococcaceae bacterium OttesenSCG-928-O06]|nr:acetate--CoA ligase [Ruminococcaceae bacterium OttesenSCG-928-O06]
MPENQTVYMPPQPFVDKALMREPLVYKQDALDFWEDRARELDWFEPWRKTLDWNPPFATWFAGGKLNASYNCIDRHLNTWRKNKAAIIFEGEHGDTKVYTYKDLHREVCRAANVLLRLGANKDEVVTIYMPMIPETVIAMLACTRIGVPHSVVFGGFSANALLGRINDAGSKILITCNGAYRKGRILPVIENVHAALEQENTIETVVIYNRVNRDPELVYGRDYLYTSLRANASNECPPVPMNADDPLFVLYTSGTTGKPKGVVHSTGGYLTGVAATQKYIFDLKDDDVYWCTADLGWISGHSYVAYGPLLNGATMVMYEGGPEYPDKYQWWRIIEKYGVTILYTSPTAIRNFIKWGDKYPQKHDLSSLRLLGSVGEPISPDAWEWFHRVVGGGRCPIVDTWWQTETGMIMLSPVPALTPLKPGSCTKPFPGVSAAVLNEEGNPVAPGEKGFVGVTQPWPAMLKTLYKDDERYVNTYWKQWDKPYYFAGDGATIDEDGYVWIEGRVDDVINVSGHRIGTNELESTLAQHEAVAEAACIGVAHEIKGQVPVAFLVLKEDYFPTQTLIDALHELITEQIGKFSQISEFIFTAELPKTQSGKTIRRILQNVAEGNDDFGDITTLANPDSLEDLRKYLGNKLL